MDGWLIAIAVVGWLGFGWMTFVRRAQLRHMQRRQEAPTAPSTGHVNLIALAEEAERDGLVESGALYRSLHEAQQSLVEQDNGTAKLDEQRDARRRRTRYDDPEREREQAEKQAARDRMKSCLRAASREEYGSWLTQWAKRGGKVSHYDYPMERRGVWVATRDLHVERLCGSWALGIILVPSGVTVTGSEPGHTDVAWMDGSRTLSFHGDPMFQAPSFSDVLVHA